MKSSHKKEAGDWHKNVNCKKEIRQSHSEKSEGNKTGLINVPAYLASPIGSVWLSGRPLPFCETITVYLSYLSTFFNL